MLLGVKSSCPAGGREGRKEWKWTKTIPLESLERGGSVLETIESEILKFPGGEKFLGETR